MPVRGEAWRLHLALVFVQVTFGAFHVVGKSVLAHLPPLALAGLRVAVSAPLLLVLAWRWERALPRRADLAPLALLGMLGVFANQVFYITGLRLTTATNAGILMPSIPVFTLAAAVVLGRERIDLRAAAGVALSAAGALVILDPARWQFSSGAGLGDLLILGNCLAYALYLVLQQPLLRRLPPLTVVAWAFLFGGGATLLVALPSLASLQPATVPAAAWLGVAYIALIPTAVNYAINSWALRRSSPALVATYTTLQPVAAALLGVVLLGERSGPRQFVGFSLIVAGLAAVALRRPAVRGQQA